MQGSLTIAAATEEKGKRETRTSKKKGSAPFVLVERRKRKYISRRSHPCMIRGQSKKQGAGERAGGEKKAANEAAGEGQQAAGRQKTSTDEATRKREDARERTGGRGGGRDGARAAEKEGRGGGRQGRAGTKHTKQQEHGRRTRGCEASCRGFQAFFSRLLKEFRTVGPIYVHGGLISSNIQGTCQH